ncbi:LysR family transcriptional regulator [Halomonas sp. SSL-5]|uniref:LysR family transcriptional regulator n=1 Tax=Halomonas sp. SSL-5 TaxID=3065855 RepID=UPI0027384C0D|nr:LysR family transcriptional regulator [Halomonas sp. SSL-5]MDY7116401.1 LysR family transcriptional regulator [Halomonas sp. SSL-5]
MNVLFDLRQARAFLAVANTLHFKQAAEVLCITQPALSRLIKGLEESIGAELFSRTTRQVALTVAGQLFLEECRLAITHLERATQLAQQAQSGDIGHLSIAYNDFSINGVLPSILEVFKERYPDISVDLVYMPSHTQHKALLDHEIDVGFLIGPLDIEGLETFRAASERIVAILPRRHRLANRKQLSLRELAEEKFILGTENGWSEFRHYIFKICMNARFTPQVVQEASTSSGIFGLVAANMGVSLYSDCINRFQRDDIAVVPLDHDDYSVETIAAWSNSYTTSSFRLFHELLQSKLSDDQPD